MNPEDNLSNSMEVYNRAEREVRAWVEDGQLPTAISIVERKLALLPHTDYHAMLGRSWIHQTEQAADWLGDYFAEAARAGSGAAIFCTMNSFELNTDAWIISASAYETVGDPCSRWVHESNRWLNQSILELAGMDELKAAFARDYRGSLALAGEVRAASELVLLLVALRMQELVDSAANLARRTERLPDDVPIFSAVFDSDLIAISASETGRRLVQTARAEAKHAASAVQIRVKGHTGPGVYLMDGGDHDSRIDLKWDCIDPDCERRQLHAAQKMFRLARDWQPFDATLRKRGLPCDIMGCGPLWAVNARAREILHPLLAATVEFLPIRTRPEMDLCILHPLPCVPLDEMAITNAAGAAESFSSVQLYSFRPADLRGVSMFMIEQSPLSDAALEGVPFLHTTCVSNDFIELVERHKLRGVVFRKVFSLTANGGEPVVDWNDA